MATGDPCGDGNGRILMVSTPISFLLVVICKMLQLEEPGGNGTWGLSQLLLTTAHESIMVSIQNGEFIKIINSKETNKKKEN